MNKPTSETHNSPALSRRSFLKHSSLAAAGAAAASNFPFVLTSHAANDMPIRVGVIGCGGRGSGAVLNVLGVETNVIYPSSGYHTEDVKAGAKLNNTHNVEIVALADVFEDRLGNCRKNLAAVGINIPTENCFTGFDGYKKLLAIPEINYVILATPPHFRPTHLKAAIEAGKHCFIEKPCAVDGPGVRMVMEAGKLAQQKNLGIVSGTQRRHLKSYNECIKRIQDGALGEIVYGSCYWNGGVIWTIDRKPEMTDMEWQMRNWGYFTWLGGDHIVEQACHSVDKINWAMNNEAPLKCWAVGGRAQRSDTHPGNIFDHFSVTYEYSGNRRAFLLARQWENCPNDNTDWVYGEKGIARINGWGPEHWIQGETNWRYQGETPDMYLHEHQEFFAGIRSGKHRFDADWMTQSTLMAIMGRMAAYTGQAITWEQVLASTERHGPTEYAMGPLTTSAVPRPGHTKYL